MTSPSVEDSVASLMQLTDDELLGRIGREAKGELAEVGMAEGPFDYLAHETTKFGVKDLQEIGARIVDRVERELHDVVCGNSEQDAAERLSIQKAIGLSDTLLSGTLVSVLIHFGLASTVAIPVTAILVKRVFHPAGQELCAFWAQRLSKHR
jgi:hypothetical protein